MPNQDNIPEGVICDYCDDIAVYGVKDTDLLFCEICKSKYAQKLMEIFYLDTLHDKRV